MPSSKFLKIVILALAATSALQTASAAATPLSIPAQPPNPAAPLIMPLNIILPEHFILPYALFREQIVRSISLNTRSSLGTLTLTTVFKPWTPAPSIDPATPSIPHVAQQPPNSV
ncbi:hypothetical protein K432DRAFT_404032 [Lepidopterella palustris CBS 459.81]|uniref:Uncharacterized protein n=1 Tax=Lepidopterella palustris CBS 459.81 TaxID=1314670 RepID=A0A8E2EC84_9PEZI|nr:hypothetical protein K432DRAFT_404032 [Lepidopterella palustris CBS 459.81]